MKGRKEDERSRLRDALLCSGNAHRCALTDRVGLGFL